MTSSRGRRNLIVARHEEIFFISEGTRLRLRVCIPSGWTKSKDLVMDGIDLAALDEGRREIRAVHGIVSGEPAQDHKGATQLWRSCRIRS